jgi:toxin YoeB
MDTLRHPFTGLGKSEPLRHELRGYWSRRINDEHRLVYKVTDEAIMIVSCRYHYR